MKATAAAPSSSGRFMIHRGEMVEKHLPAGLRCLFTDLKMVAFWGKCRVRLIKGLMVL